MGFFTLLLLAFGLSMDAFAVAVSDALCYPKMKRGWSLAIALSFGFFQALMPAIGYFAGSAFSRVLSIWDNWIAFLLLAGIGAKMIWEAVQEIRHPEQELCRFFNLRLLLMQSVATSIDALAVGMGFAILEMELFSCVAVIGIVTFLCCLGGILLGKRFGSLFRTKAEIAGRHHPPAHWRQAAVGISQRAGIETALHSVPPGQNFLTKPDRTAHF